jgi:hypothetical protein
VVAPEISDADHGNAYGFFSHDFLFCAAFLCSAKPSMGQKLNAVVAAVFRPPSLGAATPMAH